MHGRCDLIKVQAGREAMCREERRKAQTDEQRVRRYDRDEI